jgi:nucleoporin POM152
MEQNGDTFVVQGHSRPSSKFGVSESIKLLTFTNPRFDQDEPSAVLPVLLSGVPPFTIDYSFSPQDEAPSRLSMEDIQSTSLQLSTKRPGAYTLLSVSDRWCSGTVELPLSVLVEPVNPPSMTISSAPIEESCLGAIGANVNISFVGEPPFWIEYVVQVTDIPDRPGAVERKIERQTHIEKPRHTFKVQPAEAGTYRYIFTTVI